MSFDFKPEEEWSPRGGRLGKGDWVCVITDIDAEAVTQRGGHPMVVVKTAADDGEITNWIPIMTFDDGGNTFGKIVNLVLAAGVPEASWPKPGVDFDPETGKLSQAYCDRHLYNKRIGVIVRDEPDKRPDHMGEVRPSVTGYVKESEIPHPGPVGVAAQQPAFAGIGAGGNSQSSGPSGGQNVGDNIPF